MKDDSKNSIHGIVSDMAMKSTIKELIKSEKSLKASESKQKSSNEKSTVHKALYVSTGVQNTGTPSNTPD